MYREADAVHDLLASDVLVEHGQRMNRQRRPVAHDSVCTSMLPLDLAKFSTQHRLPQ